jgi:hypothetical protein
MALPASLGVKIGLVLLEPLNLLQEMMGSNGASR